MKTEPTEIEIAMDGGLREVRLLAAAVRAIADSLVTHSCAHTIELCTVEIANNCVQHGYGSDRGGFVSVRLIVHCDAIDVQVRDRGVRSIEGVIDAASGVFEFDPCDIQALPERGMGLGIVAASADRFAARREGRENVVAMSFARRRGFRPGDSGVEDSPTAQE